MFTLDLNFPKLNNYPFVGKPRQASRAPLFSANEHVSSQPQEFYFNHFYLIAKAVSAACKTANGMIQFRKNTDM